MRLQGDRMSIGHLHAQARGAGTRHHEGKSLRHRRVEVTPANHVRIQSRPRRGLIRHVADDPGCTEFDHRQRLHDRQHAVRQNDLAAHILAGIIRLGATRTHVDQRRHDIRAVAVIGEPDRIRGPVA
jgi:hypothetical protein